MLSKMATGRVLSVTQNSFLNFPGKCWNFQQRYISKQRIVMELLGNVNKPKKPVSAFLKFVADRKSEIAAEYPGKKLTDLMKVLGSYWAELPKGEKQKYFDKYEEEKKKYFEEMKTFEESLNKINKNELIQVVSNFKNSEIPNASAIIKKVLNKSLNKPKAPVAPYIKFVSQVKGEQLEGKLKIRELVQKWKNLPEEEKKKYKEEFSSEWEKYEKKLEMWEKEMIKEGQLDVIRLKTLKEKLSKTS